MSVPRAVKAHPAIAAAVAVTAYRSYTEHQHPGRRAQRRKRNGSLVLFIWIGAIALAVAIVWLLLCILGYWVTWIALKVTGQSTKHHLFTVPGFLDRARREELARQRAKASSSGPSASGS
ncbi:MAG: hypothetical protein ACR2MN_01220 [Acidimicrobiales bacterium]